MCRGDVDLMVVYLRDSIIYRYRCIIHTGNGYSNRFCITGTVIVCHSHIESHIFCCTGREILEVTAGVKGVGTTVGIDGDTSLSCRYTADTVGMGIIGIYISYQCCGTYRVAVFCCTKVADTQYRGVVGTCDSDIDRLCITGTVIVCYRDIETDVTCLSCGKVLEVAARIEGVCTAIIDSDTPLCRLSGREGMGISVVWIYEGDTAADSSTVFCRTQVIDSSNIRGIVGACKVECQGRCITAAVTVTDSIVKLILCCSTNSKCIYGTVKCVAVAAIIVEYQCPIGTNIVSRICHTECITVYIGIVA